MSTLTAEQQRSISRFLEGRHIPSGLGNEREACSIAAINLALTGTLTDLIPNCMSPVIGRWIIGVQDAMPDARRNSAEWRGLLPLAAGTGRDHEAVRSAILLDWMWDVVLPQLQSLADKMSFGAEWRTMTIEKTAEAARAAAEAAAAAARAGAAAAAARAARAAAEAAEAARAARAAWAAAAAARAAAAAARAAEAAEARAAEAWAAWAEAAEAWAAEAAEAWAAAAEAEAEAAARAADFWKAVDPVSVLQRLIGAGAEATA